MKTLFYSISPLSPTQQTFWRLLIHRRHLPPNTLLSHSHGRWQAPDDMQTNVVANLAVTAFSTYSTAKVLAAFCQQWKPTESESEKAEKLPPYFYQCLLKPRATSRLVLLASNTHTHTHTHAHTHTHTHTHRPLWSLYFSQGQWGAEIEAASTLLFSSLGQFFFFFSLAGFEH